MTNSTADFSDDRARWLLGSLSLSSEKAALKYLCQGWRQFIPAMAVFICHHKPSDCSGGFVCGEDEPKFFPSLDVPQSATDEAVLPPDLSAKFPVDELILQPGIGLEGDETNIGMVWLWTTEDSITPEVPWLKEATARILQNRRQVDKQLLRDKLEALGEYAAGAGHEINNPVATIAGRVRGLLQRETDHERRRQLQSIGGQALRIRDMIGDTMLFARPPQPHPERYDLQSILPEIVAPLQTDFETRRADFQWEIEDSVPIFADRTQLAVVITELLRNSLDWLNETGRIHLQGGAEKSPAGPLAKVVIDDDGESFTEEQRPHLFDPFFSGRQAGRGLGFGLSKCWRIVSNHHGTLDIASRPEQGTRITVTWPAYDFLSTST